jgi:hypothetical protein
MLAAYSGVDTADNMCIIGSMKHITPTQSARLYGLRAFGAFWVIMPEANKRQLVRAYLAGLRRGRNSRRNGK